MLELDSKTLRKILTDPKNALTKQYVKLFEMDNIKLEFSDAALDEIVKKAVDYKLGARGLRSICESILLDDMFNSLGVQLKNLLLIRIILNQSFQKLN